MIQHNPTSIEHKSSSLLKSKYVILNSFQHLPTATECRVPTQHKTRTIGYYFRAAATGCLMFKMLFAFCFFLFSVDLEAQFSGGTGVLGDPYQIHNLQELEYLAEMVNTSFVP